MVDGLAIARGPFVCMQSGWLAVLFAFLKLGRPPERFSPQRGSGYGETAAIPVQYVGAPAAGTESSWRVRALRLGVA